MPKLIESGHLYIAQPPLYAVTHKKKIQYAFSESERDAIIKSVSSHKYHVQRYKGLGEMNPEQLWETTLDPEHRTLLAVNIEDTVRADETFDMLMGSAVLPRRRFIQTHAKQVKNLDV